MNWTLFFSVATPAVIAVIGWFFANRLAAKRERLGRRRDARVKSLEQCYLRLALASNRLLTDKMKDDIELFVSEIQLYGTPEQIKMMQAVVEAFKTSPFKVMWDDLLVSLRDELRKELTLEPVQGLVWWLRLGRDIKGAAPNQSPDPTPASVTPAATQTARLP